MRLLTVARKDTHNANSLIVYAVSKSGAVAAESYAQIILKCIITNEEFGFTIADMNLET